MSSFPHYNALASTLISTSPTSGLESLISRARTHPNARPHQASPPNGGTRSPAGNHRRPRRLSSSSTAEDEESMLFDETAPLTQNYGALAARRPSHASSTRSGRVGGQEIHLPGIFEPHVLTVEQGGETAEEEEERILGHASTEDESRDWRAMVKVSELPRPCLASSSKHARTFAHCLSSIGSFALADGVQGTSVLDVSRPPQPDGRVFAHCRVGGWFDLCYSDDPCGPHLWANRVIPSLFPVLLHRCPFRAPPSDHLHWPSLIWSHGSCRGIPCVYDFLRSLLLSSPGSRLSSCVPRLTFWLPLLSN